MPGAGAAHGRRVPDIRRPRLSTTLLLLSLSGTAFAGRPLDTDDATVIPANACQLETFTRRLGSKAANPAAQETGFAPTCNPFGFGELLIGDERDGARIRNVLNRALVQFKSVPIQVGADHAGFGMEASMEQDLLRGQGRPDARVAFVNAIASVPVAKAWQVDANLGWLHELPPQVDGHRNHLFWGLAGEWAPASKFTIAGERVATPGQGHRSLLGTTYAISRQVTLDAAVGRRYQPDDHAPFVTIGLTIVSRGAASP